MNKKPISDRIKKNQSKSSREKKVSGEVIDVRPFSYPRHPDRRTLSVDKQDEWRTIGDALYAPRCGARRAVVRYLDGPADAERRPATRCNTTHIGNSRKVGN